MAVVLVALTFAVFVAVDYFRRSRRDRDGAKSSGRPSH